MATVTITITGINDAPIAVDDIGTGFSTDEETALPTASVLINDHDAEGDAITITQVFSDSLVGILTDNGSGSFNYDPDGQFNTLAVGEQASDIFSYTIHDGVLTDTAVVVITINGVNDAPIAVGDAGSGFTGSEDTSFTTGNVLINDSDSDSSDTLFVQSIDTTGTIGAVSDNGDGSFEYDPDGQFDYLADSEQTSDIFNYTVSDSNGGTDTATITITVTGINDNPIARDDGGLSAGNEFRTDEGTAFTTASVLANDTDPEGTSLTITDYGDKSILGTLTYNGDGTFNYDPDGQHENLAVGERATETFTYTVSDGSGGSATATVRIIIMGVNDVPTANDDGGSGFNTNEDILLTTASVLTNDSDPDGDTLSLQSFRTTDTQGLVISNGDGTFDYDPDGQFEDLDPGETATDTFSYTISDGHGDTDTATVTIIIKGVLDDFLIYLPLVRR